MEDKYIGKQFGCYKIIGISDKKMSDGHKIYIGECVFCGFIIKQAIREFKRNIHEKCYHYITNSDVKKTLLMEKWTNIRISRIYHDIKSRCYSTNNNAFKFYGEKGIKMCDKWLNNPKLFEQWALENGYQDDLTIDRIDENKDYCPENCRWITHSKNSKFKSTTNYIEVNGILDSGKGWSRRLDLPINFINKYLRNNGIEETVNFINNCLSE